MSYLVTQMLFCLLLAFLLGLLLGWWLWARSVRTRIEAVEREWRGRLDRAKADLAGSQDAKMPRAAAPRPDADQAGKLERELQRLRGEADEARGQVKRLTAELDGLRATADEAEAGRARVAELESALAAAKASLADTAARPAAPDDLTRIEGIGPVIARLLAAGGVVSFEALRIMDQGRLMELLENQGMRAQLHDPGTWPEQAALAAEGRWEELDALQAELIGGRRIDDLTRIEGIGPQIQGLLNAVGIITFTDLGMTDLGKLRAMLEAAGSRFRVHDPETWPEQARLAAAGSWDELDRLQDELKGGRRE